MLRNRNTLSAGSVHDVRLIGRFALPNRLFSRLCGYKLGGRGSCRAAVCLGNEFVAFLIRYLCRTTRVAPRAVMWKPFSLLGFERNTHLLARVFTRRTVVPSRKIQLFLIMAIFVLGCTDTGLLQCIRLGFRPVCSGLFGGFGKRDGGCHSASSS